MKVIVIGSRGFIGKHLHEDFLSIGYDVFGADVVVDYVDTERYLLIDPSDTDFNSLFQYRKYDFCINCSGAASVPDSIKNPIRDYFLNTVNVFKILEAIKKYQPECKFVNLSSAAVYGNPKKLPIKESASLEPLSPYGIHKLHAEQICNEFTKFNQLKTCSLRIFSVYGVGLQKQLFWDLYTKTKTGLPFKLFGSGEESRDFINVADLVKAIEVVMAQSDFNADVINVATGREVKIKDVVSFFFSFFQDEVKYSFSGESRKGDPNNWLADITKLESFGFRPSVDLFTGLERYYNWVNELR